MPATEPTNLPWAHGAACAAGAPLTFSLLPCAPSDSSPRWVTATASCVPWAATPLLTHDSQRRTASTAWLLSAARKHLWSVCGVH